MKTGINSRDRQNWDGLNYFVTLVLRMSITSPVRKGSLSGFCLTFLLPSWCLRKLVAKKFLCGSPISMSIKSFCKGASLGIDRIETVFSKKSADFGKPGFSLPCQVRLIRNLVVTSGWGGRVKRKQSKSRAKAEQKQSKNKAKEEQKQSRSEVNPFQNNRCPIFSQIARAIFWGYWNAKNYPWNEWKK